MGPVLPSMDGFESVDGIHDYNPHCVRRDMTSYVTSTWATAANLLNVTVGDASRTIREFQTEIEGGRFLDNIGFHALGHAAMAADGADLYTSPNDPVFYFHHAMLNRIYWIWQVLHPEESRKLFGTLTMRNDPPSRNASLDDPLDMGGFHRGRPIRDLLGTLDGTPLCYVYE
jgi:tyrosinase